MSELIAIIPAKGHSSGIPGKNREKLGGSPLWWHSARYALAEGARTVVSTDDPETRSYALVLGLEVVDELVDDSDMLHCVRQVLEAIPSATRWALLMPTSPLRPPGLLREMASAREECCATVRRLKLIGSLGGAWRVARRRQDCKEWFYYFCGTLLTGTREMVERGSLFSESSRLFELDLPWCLQIDTPEGTGADRQCRFRCGCAGEGGFHPQGERFYGGGGDGPRRHGG